MKYSSNKDLNAFIRQLVRKGWHFSHRRKHGRLISPEGSKVLTVAKSPGDNRGLKNLKQDIRRERRK